VRHAKRKHPIAAYAIQEWMQQLLRLIKRRGLPLNNPRSVAPFFIVSSGRSGTTLLRRLLESHSSVHIPPEIHGLQNATLRYKRNRFKSWDEVVDLVISNYEHGDSFRDYDACLIDLVLELKSLPSEDRSLARIISSIYRYHAEHVASRKNVVLGDKTPLNVRAIDEIVEVFPDARIIHMLRDGIDVVYSMVEMKRYDDIDSAIDRWTDSIDCIREAKRNHPANLLEIRYEELVAEPLDVVKRVCEFIGSSYSEKEQVHSGPSVLKDIESHAHLQNALQPAFTASVGKGRRNFQTSQMRYLFERMGAQLRYCGYEVGDSAAT